MQQPVDATKLGCRNPLLRNSAASRWISWLLRRRPRRIPSLQQAPTHKNGGLAVRKLRLYRSRPLSDGTILPVMQRKRVAFGVFAPRHDANSRFARAHVNLPAALAHA